MYCLEVIRKMNGESPNEVFTSKSKFKFNKTAGCLVYNPPGVNNFKKEKKRTRKESVTQ